MSRTIGKIRTPLVLLLLWCIVTAFNITKAVHIDDTAYLEIAQNICADPQHLLQEKLNWGNSADPTCFFYHPIGLSCLFAAAIKLWGTSELIFHLILACFSGLAIVLFYRIANLYTSMPLIATVLFCLSPAFLPSQNLMLDIPITALWITFFWFLMRQPGTHNDAAQLLWTAIMASAACMIKYTSLVLPIILTADILRKKQWKLLWVLVIPAGIIGIWSLLNINSYREVHLHTGTISPIDYIRIAKRQMDWIFGIGAITPFSLVALPYLKKHPVACVRSIPWLSALSGICFFILSFKGLHHSLGHSLLGAVFFANGVLLILTLVQGGIRKLQFHATWPLCTCTCNRFEFLMALWVIGPMLFIVLFSHFMAIRHILLAVPPVVLLYCRYIAPHATRKLLEIGVIGTIILGCWISASDWEYADIYRRFAKEVVNEYPVSAQTIWYAGHWGWQWYAEKAGMRQYDTQASHLKKNALLIVPEYISTQSIDSSVIRTLRLERTFEKSGSVIMRLRSMEQMRGYYAFSILSLPWFFSSNPAERFFVYRVM